MEIPEPVLDEFIRQGKQEERRERIKVRLERYTLWAIIVYAGITLWLAITAHNQMIYSERPWIGLNVDTLQALKHGQPLKVKLTIINGGHSPALHEFQYGYLRLYPVAPNWNCPLEAERDMPAPCRGSKPRWNNNLGGSVVLPNVPQMGILESSVLDDTLINLVGNVDATAPVPNLYLFGCFNYFDEFHRPHRTMFCEIYGGGAGPSPFAIANTDNSAD